MGNEISIKEESAKINKMDERSLKAYAEKKTEFILGEVLKLAEIIKKAKQSAQEAKDIKTGFFRIGKTRKKVDLNSDAIMNTNSAVSKLASIQRETIMFACISTRFARVMVETMSAMMAKGFVNVNGSIRELDENSQDFANAIMDAASDFAKKQGAIERTQAIHAESLANISTKVDNNSSRLDKLCSIEGSHDSELTRQARKDVEHDNELKRQAENDIRHDSELERQAEVDKRLEVMILQQAEIDKIQSAAIASLQKCTQNIGATAKSNVVAMVLSVLAFVLSVAALVVVMNK